MTEPDDPRDPIVPVEESLRSAATVDLPSGNARRHPERQPTGALRLRLGDVFHDRYRVLTVAGSGGFSEVYRAEDTRSGELVALKFLRHPESAAVTLPRMRRELRLARDLGHPNIVKVHELIEEPGSCCLVMEFVKGHTLKQTIADSGPLDVALAVDILRALSSALAAVHTAGIVHRDLKPQNVMIDDRGQVKLLDFGLAKTRDSTGLTATGTILGTPDYMSPEQVDGTAADTRSDVYSLGVIAWELLVGETPFRGDSPLAVALQHVRSRVPPVDRRQPEAPKAVSRLVERMTDPDPARRPSSAEAVLIELESLDREREDARGWFGQRRLRAAAAAAALVPMLAIASWRGVAWFHAADDYAADPFADGVVEVGIFPDSNVPSTVHRLFLEIVARTAVQSWQAAEINGRELDPDRAADLPALRELGVEHLIRLELHGGASPDNPARLTARVVATADGSRWRSFESPEFVVLDIEGAERLGRMVGGEYRHAVIETLAAQSGPSPR